MKRSELCNHSASGAQRCEQIVQKAGIDWTIVRCSWFAQNFSESFFLDGIRAGELVLPAGNVGEPFVDADDIADVAVAALTDDRHVGQLYELTGPQLITFAEAVEDISRAIGREVRYVQVPIGEYVGALKETGLPPMFVELVGYLFREVLGSNAWVADGVRRALGREAKDFISCRRPRPRACGTGRGNGYGGVEQALYLGRFHPRITFGFPHAAAGVPLRRDARKIDAELSS